VKCCCVAMKVTYTQRNALLTKLGYDTYDHYLSSWLWVEIRGAVLDRDGHKCKLCGADTNIVHHINYSKDTLLGDSLDALVSVCQACHRKIEFTDKNKKRSLFGAVMAYRKLTKISRQRARGETHNARGKRKKRRAGARCACGNFRKRKKQMCKVCDPQRRRIRP
jgi:hypothetical protein